MRIVSLACSNTEIVWALGRSDWLVGVDSHSDFPPDVVEPLPRVGPDLEIEIEKVAALEPDLVLATLTVPGHETVVEGLEKAGLPFIAPAPESVRDVYANIREIGVLLDAGDRAEELILEMQAELGNGNGRNRDPAEDPGRPTVLVQWWPKPTIAPGRDSWTTDVIRAAGARNVLENEPVKSRALSDDEVRELDPDAIVISWCGVDPEKYRPDVVYGKEAWQDLDALRRGRVHCVPEAFLGRPGPRLVEGARALREVVRDVAGDGHPSEGRRSPGS